MSSSEQRVGSCLCSRIRFTVVGEPFYYAVCHCSNYKKFAGSAFMTNAFFRPDMAAKIRSLAQREHGRTITKEQAVQGPMAIVRPMATKEKLAPQKRRRVFTHERVRAEVED
ncbi:hypothetical protein C8R47DRAFT_1089183 [Mycena vitilis]|nr:hypothetical protein C8R47DRAFT_1089183 [Mycena vitilis]